MLSFLVEYENELTICSKFTLVTCKDNTCMFVRSMSFRITLLTGSCIYCNSIYFLYECFVSAFVRIFNFGICIHILCMYKQPNYLSSGSYIILFFCMIILFLFFKKTFLFAFILTLIAWVLYTIMLNFLVDYKNELTICLKLTLDTSKDKSFMFVF